MGRFLGNSIKFVMFVTFLTRDLDVKLTALSFLSYRLSPLFTVN
ncbi:hypothetical protein EGH31_0952 [Haemophilus haemolyticus]|uniref:Uncharacterized protein n=1 Tax=Haemophilus haemolyticus TaxID=726 RepID=A0AAQ1YMW3_HAEHA|nr:hypothetical protein EGH31_0952 [Haemophilus haemolyticus]